MLAPACEDDGPYLDAAMSNGERVESRYIGRSAVCGLTCRRDLNRCAMMPACSGFMEWLRLHAGKVVL